jgi:5,10-methylene-tetrahydrofolate dehydrogenase/methenyl tetrahydrofolate cyclohydrolase
LDEVLSTITQYNNDPLCVGIMCQLPLPEPLAQHKTQILETIDPRKDVDGLTGAANGKTIW